MLDIGIERALARHGVRSRVVAYSEREAAPCAVLRSRMEDKGLEPAPIWSGCLENFPVSGFHGLVDGIAAGFPCQPHSVAGKREGREDDRNLLPAILGIADAVGAWALFLENVAGLKKEFDYIADLLLQRGWNCEWGTLRASDTGAGHRRDRWFCVAHRQHLSGRAQCGIESWRRKIAGPADRSVPGAAGGLILADNERGDRERQGEPGEFRGPRAAHEEGDGSEQRASADGGRDQFLADGPCSKRGTEPAEREPGLGVAAARSGGELEHSTGERRGEGWTQPAIRSGRDSASCAGRELGNANLQREQQPHYENCAVTWRDARHGAGGAGLPVFAPGPSDPAWLGILEACPWLAPALPDDALRFAGDRLAPGDAVETESSVHGLADGLAPDLVRARADMLRIAGNGVVPWQAECAFTQLLTRVLI